MKSTIFTKKEGQTVLSLHSILELLLSTKKTIFRVTCIFVLVGLFIAIFSQKEFRASVTFIPQTSGADVGAGLGGLAAIAGINVSGLTSSASIPAALYPEILGSLAFQKKLIHSKFNFKGFEEPISYYDYYTKHSRKGVLGTISDYTIGLPFKIIKEIKGNEKRETNDLSERDTLIERVTFDEYTIIKQLRGQLDISVNEFDGYVRINATMPDPRVAAQMAVKAQEELQETVIFLKSRKAKDKLAFIEERYLEKKMDYERLQDELAELQDNNRRLVTEGSKIALFRLQSEFDMALRIYTELATQLESQRIQVKEDTPVFTTINAASIPIQKYKPSRALIVVLWSVFGVLIGVGWVLGKSLYHFLKSEFRF